MLSLDITPENEALLREGVQTRRCSTAAGRGTGAQRAGRFVRRHARLAAARLAIGEVHVYSTLRACPVCATSYAELDPRLFSYNSKQGWCPDCVGTGVQAGLEAARGAGRFGGGTRHQAAASETFAEPDVEVVGDAALPHLPGHAAQPGGAAGASARIGIADVAG